MRREFKCFSEHFFRIKWKNDHEKLRVSVQNYSIEKFKDLVDGISLRNYAIWCFCCELLSKNFFHFKVKRCFPVAYRRLRINDKNNADIAFISIDLLQCISVNDFQLCKQILYDNLKNIIRLCSQFTKRWVKQTFLCDLSSERFISMEIPFSFDQSEHLILKKVRRNDREKLQWSKNSSEFLCC